MYSADQKLIQAAWRPIWRDEPGITATGALCPTPGCGAVAVSYQPAESIYGITGRCRQHWDFICSSCGTEFTVRKKDLIFESVPSEWLLAEICHA